MSWHDVVIPPVSRSDDSKAVSPVRSTARRSSSCHAPSRRARTQFCRVEEQCGQRRANDAWSARERRRQDAGEIWNLIGRRQVRVLALGIDPSTRAEREATTTISSQEPRTGRQPAGLGPVPAAGLTEPPHRLHPIGVVATRTY